MKRANKGANIEKAILGVLKKSEHPVSTRELGLKTNRAWHSINNHCLRLQLAGKINGFRIGKMNVWEIRRKK